MGADWVKASEYGKHWTETDLRGELVFNRFLDEGDLVALQELLVAAAPRWCRGLRIWNEPRDQRPIDVAVPGALANAALQAAGERGETYHSRMEPYGHGPQRRFGGDVELRGNGPEIAVGVFLDEWVLAPLGAKKQLRNTISLTVSRAKVEGQVGWRWLRETIQTWSLYLSSAWASAHQQAEYWAKVMTTYPDPIQAVGRDFGSHLPGLFWWNFFGAPYRRLLGDDRLRSSPGEHVAVVGDGVMVQLDESPNRWDTATYAAMEQRARPLRNGALLFQGRAEPNWRGARLGGMRVSVTAPGLWLEST